MKPGFGLGRLKAKFYGLELGLERCIDNLYHLKTQGPTTTAKINL